MVDRFWIYCDKCLKLFYQEFGLTEHQTCGFLDPLTNRFCGGQLHFYDDSKLDEYWSKWTFVKAQRARDLKHYDDLLRKVVRKDG
jgi:hypothetical protein